MTSPTSFDREIGQRSLPRAHSPEVAPLSSLRVASADLSVPRASFRPLLVVVVVRSPGASDVASSRLHRHSRVVDADASGLHTLPRPSLEYRGRSGLDRHRQASQSPFSSVIGDGIAPLMHDLQVLLGHLASVIPAIPLVRLHSRLLQQGFRAIYGSEMDSRLLVSLSEEYRRVLQ